MGDANTLPDYVLNPNAVLNDKDAKWRYKSPPDYTKTRAFYEKTKTMTHEAGSLPDLVSNLVKNWEIEASFKTSLEDWRTIDQSTYTFSLNGGPPQTGDHMLRVGTYNALLTSSSYYDPEHNDFSASHKSFKRMMPTFAWEVLEVYSGPPVVIFKWRHWGEMVNDYVGYNNRGEKVTVKAHGGLIDIQGIIVAKVNSALQLEKIDVWFDTMEMFRQIAREENTGEASALASGATGCPVLSHGSA
ncbi:uncharacterized protein ACLA_044290 [Aspergillus clavatus NRRL 1]|uniref:Pathogen-related protein n=1 Tax=Aspergillus clavatus (strain ATCC 1007 / CBS 513.65 / DSM 816 / NCTC 3887 / NRRL 1 / QM 1276 / 107) TaxID=344612 RepID=A1C8S2_ASPCL|nr:uncharacterized protein ACLA_044290 [Aspergillus clavatus NRRL 1]EAW13709.1 conserved hypothetical protein [Aspergillus clavatus NRRL 1]